MPRFSTRPWLMLAAAAPALAGCASNLSLSDHDCLARAMYFESNRSSQEGMLAVGTTVMNRLDDPKFPKSVCAVVGQPHQYAPGVLDKPMDSRGRTLASAVADRVLSGERHPQMPPDTKYFHTAGYSFPYTNMHYVLVAGGNAFYEKIPGGGNTPPPSSDGLEAARSTLSEPPPQVEPPPPRIPERRMARADPPRAVPPSAGPPLVTFGAAGAEGAPPGPRMPDDDGVSFDGN